MQRDAMQRGVDSYANWLRVIQRDFYFCVCRHGEPTVKVNNLNYFCKQNRRVSVRKMYSEQFQSTAVCSWAAW